MNRLLPVSEPEHILPAYRDTPIGLLLEYHNLGRPLEPYTKAQLLIGMCMDNRKHLRIPDNLRTSRIARRYVSPRSKAEWESTVLS